MTERNVKYILGPEPYVPTLHVRIDKGGGKFLYCCILYLIIDGETREICHCDNCHDKGDHIHYSYSDGTSEQEGFDYQRISKVVEYFASNWENMLKRYLNPKRTNEK